MSHSSPWFILVFIFGIVIYNRFRIIRKQKYIIEIKNKQTEEQKAIIDKQDEILDKLMKIEGEIYYLNKNYSKAIPLFTDLFTKGKVRTLRDSVYAMFILKNSYLNNY